MTLTEKTFRNVDKAWKGNDLRDADAMSAAIPYCDVVLTDKHVAAQLARSPAVTRLGTLVLPRLRDLSEASRPHCVPAVTSVVMPGRTYIAKLSCPKECHAQASSVNSVSQPAASRASQGSDLHKLGAEGDSQLTYMTQLALTTEFILEELR